MAVVEVAAGPIEYQDTGGEGPVIVLAHGVPMDHRVWRYVVPHLDGFRVICPTLPLGGHRRPMRAEADLTQQGVANTLGDFLAALDLTEVTLVLNDWGGGQFLINAGRTERIGRLVLAALRSVRQLPTRSGQDARGGRPDPRRPVAVAAGDAPATGAPDARRLRRDVGARSARRPAARLVPTGPDGCRDPQGLRQVRDGLTRSRHTARPGRALVGVHPPGAGGVGGRRPVDARRARVGAGRRLPGRVPRRVRRLLNAGGRGSAGEVRRRRRGIRPVCGSCRCSSIVHCHSMLQV